MSKYITGQDIITDLGLKPVELFEDYVAKGLQPYNHHGQPFTPAAVIAQLYDVPAHRTKMTELYDTSYEIEEDYDRGMFVENNIIPLGDYIRNAEARIKEFQGVGWTDLKLPPYPQEADSILNALANAYFLIAELNRMLTPKKGHIDIDPAEDPPPLPRAEKIQKERPSQRHRRQCREVAEKIWAENPDITIADLVVSDEITQSCDGHIYQEKTIRGWINDLCPNRSPGRRKKKDKK